MAYDWTKMEGKDILKALEDADAMQNCAWDRIDPFAWTVVLKAKPELAAKCDWSKLPAWNQMRILLAHPELAKFADFSGLEGKDCVELLLKHPEIDVEIPWQNLTGHNWTELLCERLKGGINMYDPCYDRKIWEAIKKCYPEVWDAERRKNQLEAYWCRPEGENQELFCDDPRQRIFARLIKSYQNTTWHQIQLNDTERDNIKNDGAPRRFLITDHWFDSLNIIETAEREIKTSSKIKSRKDFVEFCEEALEIADRLELGKCGFNEEQKGNFAQLSKVVSERFDKRSKGKELKISRFEAIMYEELQEPYRTVMKMQKLLPGLGIALVCDFLKESHLCNIAKPDVHIDHVFSVIDRVPYSMDLALVRRVAEFAAAACRAEQNDFCNSGAYNVDKIIWMICSDYNTESDKKKKISKGEFLKKLAETNKMTGDPYEWFLLLMKQPQLAPPEEWWRGLRPRGDLPWGKLLAAQPQFEKYCRWELVSRLELVELAMLAPDFFARQFPNGRWQDLCAFLTSSEWEKLLRNIPGVDKHLDMDTVRVKLSPNQWLCVLAFQPQLEKYFDWSTVEKRPNTYWSFLLSRQPQFADHCDWPDLTGWQIRQILARQPQLSCRCNLSLLTGKNWSSLLSAQPQFADKCDFGLLDDEDWDNLLKAQPQFSDRRSEK